MATLRFPAIELLSQRKKTIGEKPYRFNTLKKIMVANATTSVQIRMYIKKITIGKAACPSQMKNRIDRAESRQCASAFIFIAIDNSSSTLRKY